MMSRPRTDAAKLQIGEHLSDIQYYKITKINANTITVVNERGFESEIDKDIVQEGMYSASQYEIEKTVTRTEACELLEQAGDQVFTVNFNKQVKEKELRDKLLEALKNENGEYLTYQEIEKALKKISKDAIEGEERTLVGYLLKVEQRMGRSSVIDLDIPLNQHRIRLIDHRTLNWLILKNVKYVVK
jgi:hypothetical protein